jgi:hypothetical protein
MHKLLELLVADLAIKNATDYFENPINVFVVQHHPDHPMESFFFVSKRFAVEILSVDGLAFGTQLFESVFYFGERIRFK